MRWNSCGKTISIKITRQEVLQAAFTQWRKRSLERLNNLSDVIKSFIAEFVIEPSSPQCHLCFNAEGAPFTVYPVTLGELRATVAKLCFLHHILCAGRAGCIFWKVQSLHNVTIGCLAPLIRELAKCRFIIIRHLFNIVVPWNQTRKGPWGAIHCVQIVDSYKESNIHMEEREEVGGKVRQYLLPCWCFMRRCGPSPK